MLFDAHDSTITSPLLEDMFKHRFVVAVPVPRVYSMPDGDLKFYEWLKQHTNGEFNLMRVGQFGNRKQFTRGFEHHSMILTFENRNDAIAFKISYNEDILLDVSER